VCQNGTIVDGLHRRFPFSSDEALHFSTSLQASLSPRHQFRESLPVIEEGEAIPALFPLPFAASSQSSVQVLQPSLFPQFPFPAEAGRCMVLPTLTLIFYESINHCNPFLRITCRRLAVSASCG
jgi:hypothetical protein